MPHISPDVRPLSRCRAGPRALSLAAALALVAPHARAQCPPAGPGGLDASDGDFCTHVALSWNAPPGGNVNWYEVWRSTGTDYAEAMPVATGVMQTSYDDYLVSNGANYYYWITAWRVACPPGSNRSAPSARNQGHSNGPAIAPVTNFAAAPGCGQVEFTWSAVSGVGIMYYIERFPEHDIGFTHVSTTPLLNFTDSEPVNEVCAYRITAFPPACGASSEPVTLLGVRCHTSSPSPPSPATATDGTSCAGVIVGWHSVGSEGDTYQIWRAPAGGGMSLLATVSWNVASYTDATAAPGVVYTYVVRAANTCGTSGGASTTGYAPCPADFNCSGHLEVQDIFAFLNAWFAGTPSADFDGMSGLQVADIFAFLNAWFAGC